MTSSNFVHAIKLLFLACRSRPSQDLQAVCIMWMPQQMPLPGYWLSLTSWSLRCRHSLASKPILLWLHEDDLLGPMTCSCMSLIGPGHVLIDFA